MSALAAAEAANALASSLGDMPKRDIQCSFGQSMPAPSAPSSTMPKFCPYCGGSMPEQQAFRFCQFCGANLERYNNGGDQMSRDLSPPQPADNGLSHLGYFY